MQNVQMVQNVVKLMYGKKWRKQETKDLIKLHDKEKKRKSKQEK